MTRFLIYGYYGQGNAGDEAILSALIDGIRRTIPNPIIGVCSARPEETRLSHGVDAYQYFDLLPQSIIKDMLSKSRGMYIKSVTNFFRSDVIIIGGGGLFFDTIETNQWFFGYIDLIHRAKRFGKKVALMGISVGPLHHIGSKDATRDAFNRADLITVRDNMSKELLISCGVFSEKIHIIPDFVFTLNSENERRIDTIIKQENLIADKKFTIALTPCCYNTEKQGWIQQYILFCERAITELDCNLWLIPMQRNENHDDLTAIIAIYSGLSESIKNRICMLKGTYSAKEIQGIIGKSDFVFAERLHGSIMAINANVPVLSIAYMPKVEGVLELAKLNERIISNHDFLSGAFMDHTLDFIKSNITSSFTSTYNFEHPKSAAQTNFQKLYELSTNK